jgi:hypothetical protein
MARDRRQVLHLFRAHALQLGAEAGPGSWEPVVVSEPTPDGKGVIVVTVAPVPHRDGEREADTSTPAPRTGRPSEVAPHILDYLQQHGPAFHGDILDAMERLGFSKSATHRNLKVLVSMSIVLHPAKDAEYRLAPRIGHKTA